MNTRKTVLLLLIGVLAAVYVGQLVLDSADSVKTLGIKDEFDMITIAQAGAEPLAITRDGDRWFIGPQKYPADPGRIGELVGALRSVKILETVSSGDYERYGLEEAGRLVVKALRGGEVLRTLELGKDAATSRQTFALVDGSGAVRLLSGGLRRSFGQSVDALRDKAVYSLTPGELTRVSGAGGFVVEKKTPDAEWTSASGAALDQEKVEAWLSALSQVRALAFAEDAAPVPAAPLGSVTLAAATRQVTLNILRKEEDGRYLCSSDALPWRFYLSAYVAEKALQGLDGLKK